MRNPILKRILILIQRNLRLWPDVKVKHVLREFNPKADRLSKEGAKIGKLGRRTWFLAGTSIRKDTVIPLALAIAMGKPASSLSKRVLRRSEASDDQEV